MVTTKMRLQIFSLRGLNALIPQEPKESKVECEYIYMVAFTRNGGCYPLFRKMAETLRAHFGYHANTAESYHLHYMPSKNYISFANFSKSMKNQDLKFHPLAIFGLLDMMNGSDRANVAHRKFKKRFIF